jgi:hypothetical protein
VAYNKHRPSCKAGFFFVAKSEIFNIFIRSRLATLLSVPVVAYYLFAKCNIEEEEEEEKEEEKEE